MWTTFSRLFLIGIVSLSTVGSRADETSRYDHADSPEYLKFKEKNKGMDSAFDTAAQFYGDEERFAMCLIFEHQLDGKPLSSSAGIRVSLASQPGGERTNENDRDDTSSSSIFGGLDRFLNDVPTNVVDEGHKQLKRQLGLESLSISKLGSLFSAGEGDVGDVDSDEEEDEDNPHVNRDVSVGDVDSDEDDGEDETNVSSDDFFGSALTRKFTDIKKGFAKLGARVDPDSENGESATREEDSQTQRTGNSHKSQSASGSHSRRGSSLGGTSDSVLGQILSITNTENLIFMALMENFDCQSLVKEYEIAQHQRYNDEYSRRDREWQKHN